MNIIAFIKERARFYNCPACARNLERCEVKMLEQADSHLTVEVTCARCQVTFIVVLQVAYSRDEEGGELRDEEPAGVSSGRADPISHDEILDVHDLLRDFRGGLKDLIRSNDPRAN
ncbi:MAG TPA: hypothetical protein VG245_09105 [Candidatus Dormibacteraeota bacterium]|jgi:hypothetical protein|nr:hypothetical protein [Candidatus Dormibacteraeota bacterium]